MGTFTRTVDGVEKTFTRTHPKWIHPTKGYREFSRPRKTNARRRPIGALTIQYSTEANRSHPSGGRWRPLTNKWKAKLRALRDGVFKPGASGGLATRAR